MRGLLSPLIKLIIFLVVTSMATYVLAATIANTSFGDTTSYRADFTDASGLQVGDDVRIAGVRVGTVDSFKVVGTHKSTSPLAEVSFSVMKSRPLPKSVMIQLRYRNLVGQRYLDLTQGPGNSNDMLAANSLISDKQTTPAVDLTTLFAGFQPLFQGLDSGEINNLSGEIIQTLQGEGGSLEQLMSTVADLTNTLADKDHVIGDVVTNLASVLTTIGDRDNELSNLITQLQGFVSGLAQDRSTIGNAIDGINSLATSTAGLLTQVRAPLAKDIKDITGLVGVLNKNTGTVRFVLQQFPGTVGALVHTASYGSWFNFYLCSADGQLKLPGGGVLPIKAQPSTQARCSS